MLLDLEFSAEYAEWDAITSLMQQAADAAEKAEGIAVNTCVHVLLTGDEQIHRINREYRGVDRATDVLSFPTISYKKNQTARDAEKKLLSEYDEELNACLLGDIIISLPHAKSQAAEYGHSEKREIAYLLVHGLFHLMGYDHMQDEDKQKMREMEEKALSDIGIGRITDEELIEMARNAMQNAYTPYSHYKVGACLLTKEGKVYTGCNIENASYGATCCAERTALFKEISEGERAFQAIAIAAEKSLPWPCGICRQALNEFAPDLRVIVACGTQHQETTLSKLLPYAFGPESGVLD